ncbi:acyclic terpene utilization AtuA family protein [Microbacterium sp. BR1]|uniref:acyclic terpene utilization AtuA family protein n=1 Tax=Microbacterium sp. BR1 TaxID=1070896 RepID=UPI000C2C7009|nr:acyclic terpene utilization AtuA family protein [Microbacterium sp. BR1]
MTVRIGCATGWSRDQFHPGRELLDKGDLDYLFFDSMSELTMSAAQVARAADSSLPEYDPYLVPRLGPLLKMSLERGTRLLTNSGWLDPEGAAEALAAEARRQGLIGFTIAYITGGDLRERLAETDLTSFETGQRFAEIADRVVSAEAYLGAQLIAEALREGAHVVLTPRVTDASLVLGPLLNEYGWAEDDWEHLGWGIGIGHLIECGGQVCGGYYADPGYKEVPDLADLGYPIAEIDEDSAIITKLKGTGGLVSVGTAREQLLYEVNDPSNYFNPDVTCDLSQLTFQQVGRDRVKVAGGTGRAKPEQLKVLVGVQEGYMAEEMMSFAGPGAYERAELAKDIVRTRLAREGVDLARVRFDYIGLNSVHREATPEVQPDLYEYIVRIAISSPDRSEVDKLRYEVDPMATSGPAATGKWGPMGTRVRPVVGLHSAYIDRDLVPSTLHTITV